MLKIILVSFISLFIIKVTNAQDVNSNIANRPTIGLKAGFNYSNVYDTQGEQFNADGKFGFAAGTFISIPLGTFFGVQPELLYSQKGFKSTGSILGSTYNLKRTINYLDIPILFAIKPTSMISILAGPQYAYLLSQKDVFASGSTTVEQQQEFKNDNIRRNIFSVLGGVDINLVNIVLSARAGWDLQKNNGDGTSNTPRYRNAWYQATIGYRF